MAYCVTLFCSQQHVLPLINSLPPHKQTIVNSFRLKYGLFSDKNLLSRNLFFSQVALIFDECPSIHRACRNWARYPTSCHCALTADKSNTVVNTRDFVTLPSLPYGKRVVLVRHGESTWNAEGRIQGSSDFSVLTPKGESQAETSRQMLLTDTFEVCFHSPLQRSAKTAEIIWDSRDADAMIPLHDLREIDLYSFQGLVKSEGQSLYGPAYRMWQQCPVDFVIDSHFPVRELWQRAAQCWDVILRHPASSILVVAHNAVNQAMVATATGLGPEYFRKLLQSNCGVSVLDFTASANTNTPPGVTVNRLNQTPSPPIQVQQTGGGRVAKSRLFLVSQGATQSSTQSVFPTTASEPLTMLGVIQSRKTAELLLDVPLDAILASPQPGAQATADAIAEVQEAAECLGVECVPRWLDRVTLPELRDVEWGTLRGASKSLMWTQHLDSSALSEPLSVEPLSSVCLRAEKAWQEALNKLRQSEGANVLVVGHEAVNAAMLAHSLKLTSNHAGSFRTDPGSLTVVDFPDGPDGRAVVRCINYTAHFGRWAVPVTSPVSNDEDF